MRILSFITFLVTSSTLLGQEDNPVATASPLSLSDIMSISLIMLLSLILLVAILVLYKAINILSKDVKRELAISRGEDAPEIVYEPEEDFLTKVWKKLERKMTDSVPVEVEEQIAMDHSYDGIVELDNNLPPWWLYMFYLSIVFSVVYLFYYHVSDEGKLSKQEYLAEMEEAALQKEAYLSQLANAVDENNVVALTDGGTIANGKKTYIELCQVCHGDQGQGGVGPNFADNYWLHGGDIKDIFKTIKYGVPEKGMISWQSQLSPKKMQEVASFILTFQGTNPPNLKEPQGDLYVRMGEESPTVSELPSDSVNTVEMATKNDGTEGK